MIRIFFAGHEEKRGTLPLAVACGVGDHRALPVQGNERFDEFNEWGKQNLTVVSNINESDVVAYPHGYKDGEETSRVAEEARDAGKPCLFFFPSDQSEPTNVSYGIVYRYSMFRDQMKPHERCMPALVPDSVKTFGREYWKWQNSRPTLGFCGFVSTVARRMAFKMAGKNEKAIGLDLRARLIKSLERCNSIDCNIIAKREFWAGLGGDKPVSDAEREAARREFIDNLFNTDYNLCVRGAGNYSMRFYETLSAGRIPLFINTRCALPFEDEIDWRKHVVWVEESGMDQAGEVLAEFHRNLSDEEFIQLQRANRQLWLDYLSPQAFFRRILEKAVEQSRAA